MSTIEDLKKFFSYRLENISFLINSQICSICTCGIWLSVTEKMLFWKDISDIKFLEEDVDWGDEWSNIVVSFIHDSSRYDVQILFRPLWKDIEKVKKKLKPGALRTWIWN